MNIPSNSIETLIKTSGTDNANSKKEPFSVTGKINDDGSISSVVNTGTNTNTNTGTSTTANKQKQLDKMDFLKLLTKQLQFQDPTTPMDNTEFVAQLAQFSSLEGTTNIEKAISNLDTSFKKSLDVQNFNALSLTNASAVSLIGKKVRIKENSIKFTQGVTQNVPIRVHLGNADEAVVKIVDEDGNVVRSLSVKNKDAQNSAATAWDGMTDAGKVAKSGKYKISIEGEENDPSLYCYVEDIVSGIRYTDDGPIVKIGGKELSVGNISDISFAETNTIGGGSGSLTADSVALLGKNVKYKLTEVSYAPALKKNISVKAYIGNAQSATIHVKDASGAIVNSFKVLANKDGVAEATFDCVDYNQNGPYTFSLDSSVKDGFFFNEGKVEGVSILNGVSQLRINGVTVKLSDVFDFSLVS